MNTIGTRKWRKLRDQVLAEQPNCAGCGRLLNPGLPRDHPHAPQVDHIVPINQGGPIWDRANLQSMCRSCNRAKSDKLNPLSQPIRQPNQRPAAVLAPISTGRSW